MVRATSEDIGALYDVPPAGFVKARNALAARLRKAGREHEAREIQRLRRPATPLWAVNLLARRHPDAIRAFLDAVDRLRAAQRRGAGDLPAAIQRHRSALRDLTERATADLLSAGVEPTAEVLRRVSATLLGAAVDRDARASLGRGTLAEEHRAPGFEILGDHRVPMIRTPRSGRRRARSPRTPATSDQDGPPPHRAPDTPAARAGVVNLRRVERAREAVRRAEADEESARQRAREMDDNAARYRLAADEARAKIADLEEHLRELRRRVRADSARAQAASRGADGARRQADRAARDARQARRAARLAGARPTNRSGFRDRAAGSRCRSSVRGSGRT